jgi:hypothetical protein
MTSNINSYYFINDNKRVCQGDILRDYDLGWVHYGTKAKEEVKLRVPYLVVLSQECDLEHDFNFRTTTQKTNDKYLQSILVCPAYHADKIRKGTHLETLKLQMQQLNSKIWPNVTSNQNPRYHFLHAEDDYQIPELVIDFKHYYTIPRDLLYLKKDDHYLATINIMFRENLSQRFAFYLSRIGLPVIQGECK